MPGLGPNNLIVTFSLANGVFSGGGNTYAAQGLRTTCKVGVTGGAENSHVELAIYGLPLSVMNQLTTFGTQYLLMNENGVTVQGVDGNTGVTSTVFVGVIHSAYVDAQAMPQVCFRVKGTPGTFWNVKPQTPISIQGSGDVATIAQKIATMMGMTLENNNVNVKLSNPYFAGTATTMIQELAEHANIDYVFDKGVLAITPRGQARQGGSTPLIAPGKGLVGYPIFDSSQIVFKAEYNPNVKYMGFIQLQSAIKPACGTWKVINLEYDLEAQVPHGRWFMTVYCNTASSGNPDQ